MEGLGNFNSPFDWKAQTFLEVCRTLMLPSIGQGLKEKNNVNSVKIRKFKELIYAPQNDLLGKAYNRLWNYTTFFPQNWFQLLKTSFCVRRSRTQSKAHLPSDGINRAILMQGWGRSPSYWEVFLWLGKSQLWAQPALDLGWNLQALCCQLQILSFNLPLNLVSWDSIVWVENKAHHVLLPGYITPMIPATITYQTFIC